MRTKIKALVIILSISFLAGNALANDLAIQSANVNPEEVEKGETIENQEFSIETVNLAGSDKQNILTLKLNGVEANSLSYNNIEFDGQLERVDQDSESAVIISRLRTNTENPSDQSISVYADVTYPDDFESIEAEIAVFNGETGKDSTSLEITGLEPETQQEQQTTVEEENREDSQEETSETEQNNGYINRILNFFRNLF